MNSLLSVALSQFGVKQIQGKKEHPQIVSYFTALDSVTKTYKQNTTWCSAFVNWVAKRAGYEYSDKISPRSWLSIGTSTGFPKQGDIVVLSDKNSDNTGHVGFFIKESQKYVYLLGGNQGNAVSIQAYPKTRVLDFRRLKKKK